MVSARFQRATSAISLLRENLKIFQQHTFHLPISFSISIEKSLHVLINYKFYYIEIKKILENGIINDTKKISGYGFEINPSSFTFTFTMDVVVVGSCNIDLVRYVTLIDACHYAK